MQAADKMNVSFCSTALTEIQKQNNHPLSKFTPLHTLHSLQRLVNKCRFLWYKDLLTLHRDWRLVVKATKAVFDLKMFLVLTAVQPNLSFLKSWRKPSSPYICYDLTSSSVGEETRHSFSDSSADDLLLVMVKIKYLIVILQLVACLQYICALSHMQMKVFPRGTSLQWSAAPGISFSSQVSASKLLSS